MTKLKELTYIKESIEKQIEEQRRIFTEDLPKLKGYNACLHTQNGIYTCSVWLVKEDFQDKDIQSDVYYNDIKSGSKVTMEQDEYCQKIQTYLLKINEI